MKFPFMFPSRVRGRSAASVFALLTLMAFAPSAARANKNETAKPSARPVARLLSSSRQEVPQRERARMVAAYRNNVAANPTARLASSRAASAPMAVAAATSSERRVFELINAERRARGRRPLAWDGELTRMARYHSQNMARQDFFNHVDRDGLDMSGRAELLGVAGWRALAENIAFNQGYDDPESFAVERWMISHKHRDNILNGEFTHAGLGVARASDGRYYFTQVFVKR
ncbi:MAG TPA: CAP domain-containing protein [Pyrinomonadaceae bacterium]|nr:CAP domain-containing protein [Pyrinomonadaceae bacterium]